MNPLLKPIVDGFKVIVSEAQWVFIKGFRRWEIKQMQKRLAEEYQTLGSSYADCAANNTIFDAKSSENDLTLKQIVFLKEEITHLEKDLSSSREEFVKNRSAKLEKEA